MAGADVPSPPVLAESEGLLHASEIIASALFVLLVAATGTAALYLLGRWVCLRGEVAHPVLDSRPARVAAAAVLAAGVFAVTWARFIEPRMLRVSRLEIAGDALSLEAGRVLRLVFVSDLHVERSWHLEEKLVGRLAELRPDFVLLGGDYANRCDGPTLATLARVIRRIGEVAPVYAVPGNVEQYQPGALPVLEKAGARILRNEEVALPGNVKLRGIDWLDREAVREAAPAVGRGGFHVCLTHAPAAIPEAARAGFDLYLCGHTHGGQVRLPLYGALLTLSVHGKRFECGRYDVEGMTAYVTRGAGLEGRAAPRVRFLCPPEVVLVELSRPRR